MFVIWENVVSSCLILLILLLIILLRESRIWAIARNTILMTMRRRAPVVLVLFGLVGALGLGLFLEGDHTLIGKLRLVVTYNFAVMSALLLLLMLYLAATTLDSEIVDKQILLLDVKPVPRWTVLAGKWLGLMLLATWLLLIMGGVTYGVIIALAQPVRGRPLDLNDAYRQMLVSRRSFRPRLPDIEQEIQRTKKYLAARERLDESKWDPDKLRKFLREVVSKKLFPIPYQGKLPFRFEQLPPPSATNAEITVRYRLHGTRDGGASGWLTHYWELTNSHTNMAYVTTQRSKSGTTREFHKTARAIGPDGKLQITITNLSGPTKGGKPPARITVPLTGLEVLVPVGSFEANFARGLLLLWIRLAMIAAIGIAANTFLSGPVTGFLLLGVLTVGLLNTFVSGIVAPEKTRFEKNNTGGPAEAKGDPERPAIIKAVDWLSEQLTRVLPWLLQGLPNFDATDPVPDLLVGREISWGRLLFQGAADIGLRGGIIFLIGIVAYYHKEVGLPVIR